MNETAITVPVRDINTITSEIRYIQNDVQQYAAQGALKIGERLCEAKALLDHGEFLPWLKDEFGWTDRTAQKLMAVYREFGDSQKSLFGPEINTKTYSDLPVSKLYLLISVPESEREEFVKENNVSEISVREMEKLLREKREAEDESREAHEALDELTDKYEALSAVARDQKEELETALERGRAEGEKTAAEELARLKKQTEDAEKAVKLSDKDKKAAEKALAAAKAEAEAARRDLQQLKDNPEVPQEVMDKLRAQFAGAAEAAEARAAELEQQLKTANPTVAVFKVHFEAVQREFSTMVALINSADAETGTKLRAAVTAVLDKCKKEVST